MPLFKGSMFRGVFGQALRRAVCITKQSTCEHCILRDNCSYFQSFETEIPEHNLSFLKGVRKTPHPFIIEPPYTNKRFFTKEETFGINLVVFGEAIKHFPFYVYAMQKTGEIGVGYKREKFRLLSVKNLSPSGEWLELYNPEENSLKNVYQKITTQDILKGKDFSLTTLKLNFISPLRLQYRGQIIRDRNQLDPKTFLIAAQRRATLVSHLFNGNKDVETDLEDKDIKITENRLNNKIIFRYSNRQKKKMEMGGLTGEITLEGDFGETLALFYLAEELHLGKNTVFGFGKFNIL